MYLQWEVNNGAISIILEITIVIPCTMTHGKHKKQLLIILELSMNKQK